MKNLMKKYFILLSLVASTALSSTAAAETVTEQVATNKQWSSYILTGHSAWGTEACIASTLLAPDAILEVYAEKVAGTFTEPTVQILFAGAPQAFTAEVSTSAFKKWSFTLASPTQDPTLQAVMARLGDREEVLKALKQDNTATVKIRDAKNKLLKTMQFSLSGSSKTIDAQLAKCQLKFIEL